MATIAFWVSITVIVCFVLCILCVSVRDIHKDEQREKNKELVKEITSKDAYLKELEHTIEALENEIVLINQIKMCEFQLTAEDLINGAELKVFHETEDRYIVKDSKGKYRLYTEFLNGTYLKPPNLFHSEYKDGCTLEQILKYSQRHRYCKTYVTNKG